MTSTPFRVAGRIPSSGDVRAIAIPVDFPAVRGSDAQLPAIRSDLNGVQKYFKEQSGGKLTLHIELHPRWISSDIDFDTFGLATKSPNNSGYLESLLEVSNVEVNLAQYQLIFFIVPREVKVSQIARGSAMLSEFPVSGGVVSNFILTGGDVNFKVNEGDSGAYVRYLAHETGHTLGFYDQYSTNQEPTLGPWSIMANVWDKGSHGLVAWDRYIQGWLEPTQFVCMRLDEVSNLRFRFSGSGDDSMSGAQEAIFIQESKRRVVVVERIVMPTTKKPRNQSIEFILYEIDLSKGQVSGGYRLIPRSSFGNLDFVKSSLGAGDIAESKHLKFAVLGRNHSDAVMTIQRIR